MPPTACSTWARPSRSAGACSPTSRRPCAPTRAPPRRRMSARGGLHPKIDDLVGADRARRGLRDRVRERGADPRGQPRQDAPAALQRAAARRQELPVHRDQPRRGVSAGLLHPREAPARPALLRALLERLQGARDAQPDRQDLPEPPVRGARAGPAVRRPVPRLPHQALPGAVRRLHLEGRLPGPDRPDHRVPVGALPGAGARAGAGDARGGRGARSSSGPLRCATASRPSGT